MQAPTEFLIGGNNDCQVMQNVKMSNRHGLITGAVGTGKTITLQTLAESFSKIGVPVFLTDMKGDVSGLAQTAEPHPNIDERRETINIDDYQAQSFPTVFWDCYAEKGHPFCTSVSEFGPLFLSSLLDLNATQTAALHSCFAVADVNGWLLLDLKDLRLMLIWTEENMDTLKSRYGNISKSDLGAIQQELILLDEQSAKLFLGGPRVALKDLIHNDLYGNGIVNIFDASKIVQQSPKLYAALLLWLLSELFENLPEVNDLKKPKFVLLFDEALLLFDGASKELIDKIEQVVRLIRPKGVGIYFVAQSPLDIPKQIRDQLDLKIQHAVPAYRSKDNSTEKIIAQTFSKIINIDIERSITELSIGEALVSVLNIDGQVTPVERVLIRPPESHIGEITDKERAEYLKCSPYNGRYDPDLDREPAYEILRERAATNQLADQGTTHETRQQRLAQIKVRQEARSRQTSRGQKMRSSNRNLRHPQTQGIPTEKTATSIGSQLGRSIIRGVLGSISK
jgi:DNA helicase HerA-like ATPase